MARNHPWRALVLLVALFTAPGVPAAPAGKLPKPAAKPAPARKPPPVAKPAPEEPKSDEELPNPADYPPIEALTPVESGPGLAVCQPVLTKGGAEAGDLGDGCARWLQLIAGGHGELGKTPLWAPMDQSYRRLNAIRLTVEQGARLPQLMGVTHVALGEMAGEGERYSLTYRLWKMPEKQAVGEPLTASGTDAEIVAALPRIAAGIVRALGVAQPRVPPVGETPAELRTLGRIAWIPGPRMPAASIELLGKLAEEATAESGGRRPHPPLLGAFMSLVNRGALRDGEHLAPLVRSLPRIFPDNAIVFGEIGRQAHWAMQWDTSILPEGPLAANLRRFPNCYLFHAARAYFHRMAEKTGEARKAASQAVRCNPRSPEAWNSLDDILREQSGEVRGDRVIKDLSAKELAVCKAIYAEELKTAQKGVELDPEYGIGWRHVSIAAGFVGNGKLADEAFWKGQRLEPDDYRVYDWGVQLYQPKWFGNADKLAQVAAIAAGKADKWSPGQRVSLAVALARAGLPDSAQRVLRTDAEFEQFRRILKEQGQGEGQ